MAEPTVDDYIAAYMAAFKTRRGEKTIHAGGRAMRVRTAADRSLILPNGVKVKVSTDDSGVATQIEEDEALHAVVRPHPIRLAVRPELVVPTVSHNAAPSVIQTATTIRSSR